MTTWESVLPLWKKGSNFDRDALEASFPCDPKAKSVRAELWRGLDGNGNGYVSLAEFDGWFNKVTMGVEAKKAKRVGVKKSTIFTYARPALIRAFSLANGLQTERNDAKKTTQPLDADDYVTKSEFCLLLLATQCALRIYRVFDMADDGDDRKLSRSEWARHLNEVNAELKVFGYKGKALTKDDYDLVDADSSGQVLLDEAVTFFLDKVCDNDKLLGEAKKEPSALNRQQRATALLSQGKQVVKPKETVTEEEPAPITTPEEPAPPPPTKAAPQPSLQKQKSQAAAVPAAPVVLRTMPSFEKQPSRNTSPPPPAFKSPTTLVSADFDEPLETLQLQYNGLEIILRRTSAATTTKAMPLELDFSGVHIALGPTAKPLQRQNSRPATARQRRRSSSVEPPRSARRSPPDDSLPAGWSKRFDPVKQRFYYLDHATRTTTWRKPKSNNNAPNLWDTAVY